MSIFLWFSFELSSFVVSSIQIYVNQFNLFLIIYLWLPFSATGDFLIKVPCSSTSLKDSHWFCFFL